MSRCMKAAVFVATGRIELDERPIPDIGPLDALVRITTTTICGTDVHIMKGEYPVRSGLIIGHEPVGARPTRSRRYRVRPLSSSAVSDSSRKRQHAQPMNISDRTLPRTPLGVRAGVMRFWPGSSCAGGSEGKPVRAADWTLSNGPDSGEPPSAKVWRQRSVVALCHR